MEWAGRDERRCRDMKHIGTVSLAVLGAAVVLQGLFWLLCDGVPDAVVRTLGIVVLVALPVFAFAVVRLSQEKQ